MTTFTKFRLFESMINPSRPQHDHSSRRIRGFGLAWDDAPANENVPLWIVVSRAENPVITKPLGTAVQVSALHRSRKESANYSNANYIQLLIPRAKGPKQPTTGPNSVSSAMTT